MRKLVLIAHDLRSTHNVGSLLRTAEGLGASQVFLSGITPYPAQENDSRLPHIKGKLTAQIKKTALGAEHTLTWDYVPELANTLATLRQQGFTIAALEQASISQPLADYHAPEKIVLIVGNEVDGIDADTLARCDVVLEIPMMGQKESFNVVQAAAMALYHLTFN